MCLIRFDDVISLGHYLDKYVKLTHLENVLSHYLI